MWMSLHAAVSIIFTLMYKAFKNVAYWYQNCGQSQGKNVISERVILYFILLEGVMKKESKPI